MTQKYLFTLLLFIIVNVLPAQEKITDLMPVPFTLPGIQLAGDLETFEGEDLFDLINGGAEIYLEYGFVQVAAQNYSGINNGGILRVEIYEMTDPEAAFGIFQITAVGQEIVDKLGYYVVKGRGYGMMVRGSYFIMATFSGLNADLEGSVVDRLVESFNSGIKTYAELPKLYVATRPPCRNFSQSLYFRGKLALRNMTYFDFDTLFDFSEGVYYRCDVFDYVLLIPESSKSKKEIIQEIISEVIVKNPGYSPISKETSGFSIIEGEKLRFEIFSDNNSITIIKYF